MADSSQAGASNPLKRTSEASHSPKKLKYSDRQEQGSELNENQAPVQESEHSRVQDHDVHPVDDNANQLSPSLSFEENSNTSLDSDSEPEDILENATDEDSCEMEVDIATDEDSCEMEVDENSPDPSQTRSLAENLLRRTIEIKKSKNNQDRKRSVNLVCPPTCALLNSGGGVLVMTIDNYSTLDNPLKQLDEFWQMFENKLESMIKPSSYDEVFDREVKQDEVFLFIKAPDHWCTVESNLKLPGESKVSEPTFKNTVELLSDKPYCKVGLEKLRKYLPEEFVYIYKQKLDFHESKQIQFKHYKSSNGILHNNNRTQREGMADHISAFANGRGGIILIGVKDDGTVLGQTMDSEQSEQSEQSEGNSQKDVEQRVELIIKEMKWSCTPERNLHWQVEFIPVQGRKCCYVIAISVAGMKGGVFTKSPKSYQLRPGKDGEETVHLVEFKDWKQQMLRGTQLQNESKAMKEVTKKLKALSISEQVLLTVKGSVGSIRESFFAVGAECPVSPKGFGSNLPEAAQSVIRQLQEMSSGGRNRALLVGSRSWHGCINNRKDSGRSLSVDGVICDLLLFNGELGGLHLFTLCDSETDEPFLSYSHATAKALKKALVTIGGCQEKFYITHHVIPCRAHAPTKQIGQLSPDSRYPQEYYLEKSRDKLVQILHALVVILAAVKVPSPLSNKQGISFLNLLTERQFQLVYQEIDEYRELWIKGAAGTGKTLVAVEFIKELRRRHPNLEHDGILYVCENKGIRTQISNRGICPCVCRATFMLREDWSEVKHIVMDEVQAYRDEGRNEGGDNWLQKAKKIVRQHSIFDPGYLWLFIDNDQINHGHPTAILAEYQQLPAFRLRKVIRNSTAIVKFAKQFLDKNAAEKIEMGHDFEGEEVMVKTYQRGEASQISKLKEVIESLCTEGYSEGDIALLYGKEDVIPQDISVKLHLRHVDAESNESDDLVVSTFRKYSGLERPIVILVNVAASLPYGSNTKAIYCCATRAMVKLIYLKESQN